jgi:hypothetical protein
MLFAVFMLMYYKALKTDKKRYFIAAALSAAYATYCKEPVFGVFVIIALSNLLFRYKKETRNEKIFNLALVVNAAIFLFLYYFLVVRHASSFYNEGTVWSSRNGGRFKEIVSALVNNPFLLFMFVSGFIRLFFVIARKDREHLFCDSLLFAGMGYSCAFFLLNMFSHYYFLPAIVLFLPSLVYWTRYLREKKTWLSFFLCVLFLLKLVFGIKSEWETVKDTLQSRRKWMPYIEDLYSEYRAGKEFVWFESDNVSTGNMFYKKERAAEKFVLTTFLNHIDLLNGGGGEISFAVAKDINAVDIKKDVLFLYSVHNDRGQPMRDEIAAFLQDNGFELYTSSANATLIYRQRKHTTEAETRGENNGRGAAD